MLSKILHWLLLVATVVFLISGLGISYYRVVETITFGILTKSAAFHIHEGIWIPFTVLLLLHLILTVARKHINRLAGRKGRKDT